MLAVTYQEVFLLGGGEVVRLLHAFLYGSYRFVRQDTFLFRCIPFLYSMVRFPHEQIRFFSDPVRCSVIRKPISFVCPFL